MLLTKILRRSGLVTGFILMVASVVTVSFASAGERTKTNTIMTVGEMCGGCVKKITKRFDGVEGVAKVQCSIEEQSVTLVPKRDVRLSPKAIWEIMESIGKTPEKMISPDGTFTSKPKS